MKVLIVDNGTKHLGKLKELFYKSEIKITPLFSSFDSIGKYDLIILSGGSSLSVPTAPEIFKDEIKLAKSTTTPLIGICQGCEIIAKAYGSKLDYIIRKAQGLKRINVLEKNSIFGNIDYFKGYEAHHFAITSLGKNLIGLAKSEYGYEVIKHRKKRIYGLQFHPEMLIDKSLGDDIFDKIVDKLIN